MLTVFPWSAFNHRPGRRWLAPGAGVHRFQCPHNSLNISKPFFLDHPLQVLEEARDCAGLHEVESPELHQGGASYHELEDIVGIHDPSHAHYRDLTSPGDQPDASEGQGLDGGARKAARRSEEHTSELQSPCNLVCRLLLEK